MLSGLLLNAVVTDANAGVMPVVDMPSTVRPSGPMWGPATSETRLSFLADQARLGLFSFGDLMLLCGGFSIVFAGLRRTGMIRGKLDCRLQPGINTDSLAPKSDS